MNNKSSEEILLDFEKKRIYISEEFAESGLSISIDDLMDSPLSRILALLTANNEIHKEREYKNTLKKINANRKTI